MKFPLTLLGVYIAVFIVCAISPHDRAVWWAENLPIIMIVVAIMAISRYFKFSRTAYVMMTILPILHTIGGHYTFARVPFDFITNLLGASRNHYDRVAHFTVGFYAYPLAEYLLAKKLVRSRFILVAFPIAVIFATAALYEIFEWIYAVCSDPSAGTAVLGSQGDEWDAQRDMLADGLGSITAMILFWSINRKSIGLSQVET